LYRGAQYKQNLNLVVRVKRGGGWAGPVLEVGGGGGMKDGAEGKKEKRIAEGP
jgi:hypothetical protein